MHNWETSFLWRLFFSCRGLDEPKEKNFSLLSFASNPSSKKIFSLSSFVFRLLLFLPSHKELLRTRRYEE